MDDATLNLFGRLGISLAIGMLVGLQREATDNRLAGVRTITLTGLAGTLTALVDSHTQSSGWIIAAGIFAIGAIVVVSEMRVSAEDNDIGMTTAIAVMIVYLIGVYLLDGSMIVAAATGVSLAALLQLKPELHSIAGKLDATDIRAILQFAVFSCIVLPVLPNEPMGPLNVFNPFKIWLMVVLIVGISLVGYIAYKFFGRSAGVLVGGILGGAISSTATSLSYGRKARQSQDMSKLASTVIMIASSVVFIRVLIEIAVVAPSNFTSLGVPMVIMLAACIAASLIGWSMFRGKYQSTSPPSNPSEFKSALLFGGLYALVLWGLAATKQYLNDDALYVIAALSGLTDMDAITLSTAQMVEVQSTSSNESIEIGSSIDPRTGWKLLVTAAISNLVFKAGIVAAVGGWRLFLRVGSLFAIPILCGAILIWFW